MKNKKAIILSLVAIVCILICVFVFIQMRATNKVENPTASLSSSTEANPEATATPDAEPVFEPVIPDTISSTPDTYIDAPTGGVVNKENDVSIYPVVEWAPFSENAEVGTYTNPYTVNLDLFTHGFVEVSLETALNDTTYAVRKIEDIEYSFDGKRAQMRFTYVTEEGSSVWELHAENTGEELDISDIGEADPLTMYGPESMNGGMHSFYMSFYYTPDGEYIPIQVFLFYSPKTGNMYSLHSDSTEGSCPSILYYNKEYLPESYLNPNAEQIEAQFTIKLGQEEKTYSYMTGMMFEDWVDSKYNTDGWRLFSGLVISPDDEYYMFNDDIIRPYVRASKR